LHFTFESAGHKKATVTRRPFAWCAQHGRTAPRPDSGWLRHRLRAIQLKHWKRPKTIYPELKALGAKENVARQVAVNSRRWWRNSARLLNSVLTIAYFDGLGLPRLS